MSNLFNRIEALWSNLKEGKAIRRAHFLIYLHMLISVIDSGLASKNKIILKAARNH